MGQYFGIKPDEEKYIWEVAEMGLCAPLPPGWKEEVAQEPTDAAPGIAFRYAAEARCKELPARARCKQLDVHLHLG